MNDQRIDAARETLSNLPEDRKMPGLTLEALGFDFYTSSFRAVFQWEGASATLVLSTERMQEIEAGGSFVLRRLRNEIRTAFNVGVED